jgi:FlaA1/EpsC-like NDP-sugar epimerase
MRNEEELYAEGVDPKEHYINHILPKKLRIDLEYIDNVSVLKDMLYILQGIRITVTGAITRRHIFENAEQIALFLCDTFICAFSYSLAYFLRMEGELPPIQRAVILKTMPYVIIARMFAFAYFGLYGTMIRYVSFAEIIKVVKGTTLSSIFIILLTFLIGERSHPRSVFAIDWFILLFFMVGYRFSWKALGPRGSLSKNQSQQNILIYGAEDMGNIALRYFRMQGNGNVVAFVDDDPKKVRKRFWGVKVLGNRYDIESLVKLYQIDQIVIARRDMASEDLEHIKSLCEKAKVHCEVFALAN